MRFINHYISRNIFNWKGGNYTLELRFRGTREELMQKLKEELEQELSKHA